MNPVRKTEVATIIEVVVAKTIDVPEAHQIPDVVEIIILILEVILVETEVVILADKIILIKIIFRIILDRGFNVIVVKILATNNLNVGSEKTYTGIFRLMLLTIIFRIIIKI
mgnify:CR=1 FL=1